MTQRRVDKKSLKFDRTMTRNGKTVTAPRGFWFQFDSSATGDKVRPNKKLWWRLLLAPHNGLTYPEKLGDALPDYVWSNFKQTYDFQHLLSELSTERSNRKSVTSETLAASYYKWQLEDPEIEPMKKFLESISPILQSGRWHTTDTASKFLHLNLSKKDGTPVKSTDFTKYMEWKEGFPTSPIPEPYIVGPSTGLVFADRMVYRVKRKRTGYWDEHDWFQITLDPQNTVQMSVTSGNGAAGSRIVRSYLAKKIKDIDLSIENLGEDGGAAKIISMELKSQENVFEAQTKLNKLSKHADELFALMKSGKYDKKKLNELLNSTRDMTDFLKNWTERRDSLPWR